MKKLFLSSLIFLSVEASAFKPDDEVYRLMLEYAYHNADSAKVFYKSTRKINEFSTPLMLGFKAMADIMMCNFVGNPFVKLAHFNSGKKLLEVAIEKDLGNPELRFMRFCTQDNAPSILNYDHALDNDKNFLIKYLKTADSKTKSELDFRENVRSYLLKNSMCNIAEKSLIQNL